MAEIEFAQFSSFVKRVFKSLAIGVFLFVFLLLLSISIFHLIYLGRIFPGVFVGEYPVGGLTVEQAAVTLTQHYSSSGLEKINFSTPENSYQLDPSEIGLSMDAVRSALSAFHFGRSYPVSNWLFEQIFIFSKKVEIPPVLIFDQNIAFEILENIARTEDIPLKEASLLLEGTKVIATPGQVGRTLDQAASLEKLTAAINNYDFDTIDLVVKEETPTLLDATPFLSDAQIILDRPFTILAPEGIISNIRKWTITPENLAPMLTFSTPGDNPQKPTLQFIDESLDGLIRSISEQVDSAPKNPRFIFNDESRELDLYQEGMPGINVDIPASKAAIQSAMTNGNNHAELVINTLNPEVADDATAEDLGITELVHVESSYFYGSDSARVQNIETASNEFLGVLVKPGETFSMADIMGDISLDNGYSEALIIYNGKTIEGVGGGVCQVSTTLFRTAFFAGFPIEERHPHAYRVSYYEKVAGNNRDPNLAGLDATVYIPLVDLKFTNDTPYWLLMEAYVNRSASRLTWKFYSTYDGRSVEWNTTGLTNKIEPKEPLYKLNETLEEGEIKQVDWEAEGADVTVSRIVYKHGDILLEDDFFTRYAPWRAVYEYGPGTDGIPEQEND